MCRCALACDPRGPQALPAGAWPFVGPQAFSRVQLVLLEPDRVQLDEPKCPVGAHQGQAPVMACLVAAEELAHLPVALLGVWDPNPLLPNYEGQ